MAIAPSSPAVAPPAQARNTARPPTRSGRSSSATSSGDESLSAIAAAPTAPAASMSTAACDAASYGPIPRSAGESSISANLRDRIAEAEREGWLGEVNGLKVSLAAADQKLAQLDQRSRRAATVNLGLPAFGDVASCTALLPERPTAPRSC